MDKENIQGFIKNEEILEEDYKIDDLLGFDEIIQSFKDRLSQINKNSIVGLVGKFGSGKSTMLYQIYSKSQNDNAKWINFDAWKFPERKDLWEGFVLDVARNINKKLFNEARKKIDGEQNNNLKNLIKVIFQGANIFIPGASTGQNFASLLNTSPIKRVFEFQEILKQMIDDVDKDLYIIVEDIDRSGDRGIFFLETLKNFIKENNFKKKIIIIVPIGESERNKTGFKEAYDKILDYDFLFKPENIDFTKFIKAIIDDKFFSKDGLFEYHLNYLLKLLIEKKNFTIRELKGILRLANIEYKKLDKEEKGDINIFVWVVFAEIYKYRENFLNLINDKQRFRGDFWARKFFVMLANNIKEEQLANHKDMPFFIVDNDKIMSPKFHKDYLREELSGYHLSNRYLKYFK